MNKLFLAGTVLLFSGCAMPQQGMMMKKGGIVRHMAEPVQQPRQFFVDEVIEVLTEPAGARIHINDAFAGYSPVKAPVRRMWRGDPQYPMTLDLVKIEALPVGAGQCVQTGVFGQNSAKTPPQVSFNMTACAPAQPSAVK